jgi:transposase InsO family protein
MKYAFIDAHRFLFHVKKMCRILGASKSGYYAWRGGKKTKRQGENEMILKEIQEAYTRSRGTYGSPRISRELHEKGIYCSEKRIARLMRANNIMAKTKRRFKATTNSRHTLAVAPNLVQKEFSVKEACKVWVSDITYIWTDEGWLYLAIIMDLFTRGIVGWAMSDRITAEMIINALEQATTRRNPPEGLIFHSDRGSQYASDAFCSVLKRYGCIQSMSDKGDCYDNAVAESFFHTLKTEHVYFERYKTREEARCSIFEYIEVFYNRIRRHSTIGSRSPYEFEEMAGVV